MSRIGTFRTCCRGRSMSVVRGRTENIVLPSSFSGNRTSDSTISQTKRSQAASVWPLEYVLRESAYATARVHHPAWRRGGCTAARGAGAGGGPDVPVEQ